MSYIVLHECTRCPLHLNRTQVVKGTGSIKSSLWIIGQNPGDEEDKLGEPFVGTCGRLVDNELRSIGVGREEVYFDNANKCTSPGNRAPTKDELQACYPWLQKSLKLGSPKLIIAMGNSALNQLTGYKGITKWRGYLFYYTQHDFFMLPTFHPSAILREGQKGKRTEDWNQDWDAINILSKHDYTLMDIINNPVEKINIKLYE